MSILAVFREGGENRSISLPQPGLFEAKVSPPVATAHVLERRMDTVAESPPTSSCKWSGSRLVLIEPWFFSLAATLALSWLRVAMSALANVSCPRI